MMVTILLTALVCTLLLSHLRHKGGRVRTSAVIKSTTIYIQIQSVNKRGQNRLREDNITSESVDI